MTEIRTAVEIRLDQTADHLQAAVNRLNALAKTTSARETSALGLAAADIASAVNQLLAAVQILDRQRALRR